MAQRCLCLTGLALWTMAATAPVALAQMPPPVMAKDGQVLVTRDALGPVMFPPANRQLVRVTIPPRDPAAEIPIVSGKLQSEAATLLRRFAAEGVAAGNHGDLYENRDRDHSPLRPGLFPQLTYVRYGPHLIAAQRDYGAAAELLYDAPLIGNSSTALTSGPFWRSQPRFLLTEPRGALRLYQNYRAGQIHIYPEHRDHDPERGDLMPANTPYMLISQGSSGSDQVHMQALVMILAAFRPDTKARLVETGLLAPMVQMIYRRSGTAVRSAAAYRTALAHPTAFAADQINAVRAVALANAIRPDEIPPMVQLRVLDESRPIPGIDFFGDGLSERLFDTPAAIARVWRSRAATREMRVSAAATQDPNGRPLSFDWVLLRGDPDRVEIVPLNDVGTEARITLGWQAPQPVPGRPSSAAEITSHRIDIAVIANNGVYDSAPSFISVLLPRHEIRSYDTGPDGALRPESIDRRLPRGAYADPLIFPRIPWRDVYHYGPEGSPLGWTREMGRGGAVLAFDATGRGPDGRPIYAQSESPDGVPRITIQPKEE